MRDYTFEEIQAILAERERQEKLRLERAQHPALRRLHDSKKKSANKIKERNKVIYAEAKVGPCSVCGRIVDDKQMNLVIRQEFRHEHPPAISQRLSIWSEERLRSEIARRQRVCSSCLPFYSGVQSLENKVDSFASVPDEKLEEEVRNALSKGQAIDLEDERISLVYGKIIKSGILQ